MEAPATMVAESVLPFECEYLSTTHFEGDSPTVNVDVVLGRVVHIHIDDVVIDDQGKLDILRIEPIACMGYYDDTVVKEISEMIIPGASEEELVGLEGTSV